MIGDKEPVKKGAPMKPFPLRLSRFIFCLSSLMVLALALSGCRASGSSKLQKGIVEEITPQILLRVQIIALREVVSPSDDAPFPALGFQFSEDRVVPVEKPDTIAGVELTAPQLNRWMENLGKAGAALYAAPVFTVGPGLPASTVYSTEKLYQANWHVDSNGASAQNASILPETKFTVQPEPLPGIPDLLTSVDAEVGSADLNPFTLVDDFAVQGKKTVPLSLLLPRQDIRRMITQTLIRPGQALVLAHYVRQYRAEPQPPKAAEDRRDHIFCLLSAERRGPEEARSDLPIVPQIPPRYALSLTWINSGEAGPAQPPPDREKPAAEPGPGDSAELQKAAAQMKGAPGAFAETLSLALTAKTQAQFEIAEERGCVAGIRRDSDAPESPYSFIVNQAWAGVKLSARLEPVAKGVSATLNLRLADPPHCEGSLGKLPSLRPGSPETEVKEYHFQVATQASAEFASTQLLQPGQTWLPPMTWRTTGNGASQNARLRLVAISLKEMPAPAAETPPQGGPSGAPAHP